MLFLFLKCGFCSQLLEAQADYHRKALAVIEKVLPEIQAHQGKVTCALADASLACATYAQYSPPLS